MYHRLEHFLEVVASTRLVRAQLPAGRQDTLPSRWKTVSGPHVRKWSGQAAFHRAPRKHLSRELLGVRGH